MLRFPYFEELGAACAAISDVTEGDCGSTDIAAINRDNFLRRCGARTHDVVCPNQVHGTNIFVVQEPQLGNATGDGLITQIPMLPIGITVADCVPIFLLDPVRGVGGLAHAGREGTYLGVTQALVQKAQQVYSVQPEDLHAIIGPSAGPCCYEVSTEIAERFKEAKLPVNDRHLDLWTANQQQLIAAGLPANNIQMTRHCTICEDRFHSYRRSATDARNLAVLMLSAS